MSLIELSPLFTRRQLKNQKDNNRRNLRLGAGGPEVRQGKGSTGTAGGDVASFPLATTFFIFSSTHPLYFCGTKCIHKLVLTKSQVTSSTFANFSRFFSHMEVTLAQMIQGTFFKIPASGQNVPQCARFRLHVSLLVYFT